jgi:hypothetical protein
MAKGSIDLSTAQAEVFNQTVSVMTPFFDAFFQGSLESFKLGLTFLKSETTVLPASSTGSAALVESYFVAEVSFHVETANMDALIAFDKNKATATVEQFYQGQPRDVLLQLLHQKGIELDTIRVFKGSLPTNAVANGGGATQAPTLPPTTVPHLSAEKPQTTTPQASAGGGTNTALYAGIVSGGVIMVAIAAVVYTSRRSDGNFFRDAMESVSDSLYNDSFLGPPGGKTLPIFSTRANATASTGRSSLASSSYRCRIKPAAITLRSKKAPQQLSGSVSTIESVRLPPDQESRAPPIDERETDDDDHLHRMEDGPDLVACRALTYHDTSVQGLIENYPEFDVYHQANPYGGDTAWSVDGLTIENESNSVVSGRPRRWQDDGESLLSELPDHNSSVNGSVRS